MEVPQPHTPPAEPTHDPPPAPLHPSPGIPEPGPGPGPAPRPLPGEPEPGPRPSRDPPLFPEHDRAHGEPYVPEAWTPDLPLDEVVFDESQVPG